MLEIKNMFLPSILSSNGETPGTVNVGNESEGGETVRSPPFGGK